MDLSLAFSNINWLSVIVASLAAFAIGSVWYSPVLFSKTWQKESNLTNYDLKNASMPVIFGFGVRADVHFGRDPRYVHREGRQPHSQDSLPVSWRGIGWIVTALGVNYLFARKSITLFLIDAGYFVVFFAAMGLILGAW